MPRAVGILVLNPLVCLKSVLRNWNILVNQILRRILFSDGTSNWRWASTCRRSLLYNNLLTSAVSTTHLTSYRNWIFLIYQSIVRLYFESSWIISYWFLKSWSLCIVGNGTDSDWALSRVRVKQSCIWYNQSIWTLNLKY